jgi:hypothetical protein
VAEDLIEILWCSLDVNSLNTSQREPVVNDIVIIEESVENQLRKVLYIGLDQNR